MNDLAVKQKTEVATVEITPMQMIQTAMEKGLDAETLSKMMDLQERHEANQAKKAYVQAMNEFSANRPKITKNKEVSFKSTSYKHASLDWIIEKITPALVKYGLSYNWITKQDGELISVSCKVTHVDGHSEQTSMSAGADQSGGKNSIQAVGSTTSYLQRYTLCSILGLASSDDDDGATSDVEYITESQVADIESMIAEVGADRVKFLGHLKSTCGAKDLHHLRATNYQYAIKALEAKRKAS